MVGPLGHCGTSGVVPEVCCQERPCPVGGTDSLKGKLFTCLRCPLLNPQQFHSLRDCPGTMAESGKPTSSAGGDRSQEQARAHHCSPSYLLTQQPACVWSALGTCWSAAGSNSYVLHEREQEWERVLWGLRKWAQSTGQQKPREPGPATDRQPRRWVRWLGRGKSVIN